MKLHRLSQKQTCLAIFLLAIEACCRQKGRNIIAYLWYNSRPKLFVDPAIGKWPSSQLTADLELIFLKRCLARPYCCNDHFVKKTKKQRQLVYIYIFFILFNYDFFFNVYVYLNDFYTCIIYIYPFGEER